MTPLDVTLRTALDSRVSVTLEGWSVPKDIGGVPTPVLDLRIMTSTIITQALITPTEAETLAHALLAWAGAPSR